MTCSLRAGASLSLIAATVLATGARAQQTCHVANVPPATTNWATTVAIPKFDPANSVLLGLEITLAGQATGSAKFESLDAASSTVTMNYQGTLTLRRPDNTPL